MDKFYGSTPYHGWEGDEDEGQMSAWFVMSALGLFEMDGGCSADPEFDLRSPLFSKAVVTLSDGYYGGGTFTINAIDGEMTVAQGIVTVNSEITSIRHASAMLGQRELKKWINTAVANKLYADKPNEITRLSLLRAKFAENLAPAFSLAAQAPELFLMGLFSVLDLILSKPMEEALKMVQVSKEIREALVDNKGKFAPIMSFITQYECANWQEISRLMILQEIDMEQVNEAYLSSLTWYRDLFTE